MIGNVHELPLFSNKGTEMTLTTMLNFCDLSCGQGV